MFKEEYTAERCKERQIAHNISGEAEDLITKPAMAGEM
jgi:hypothetical protein